MKIQISEDSYEGGLLIRTPGQYAMGLGVEILEFLDTLSGVFVKNIGWKNGFGISVAVWHPIIHTQNLVVEVSTDCEDFQIRRVDGPSDEYSALIDAVMEFVRSRPT